MQKIIIDTNVLVSALISNSFPARILNDIILERKVATCISKEILEEYIEVLNREKFEKFLNFKNNAEVVINKLIDIAISFTPINTVALLNDLSDNKFLELAEISKADYLITGNSLDFTFSAFKNTKILSPKMYYQNFRPI